MSFLSREVFTKVATSVKLILKGMSLLFILGCSLYFGAQGKPTEMALVIVAGGVSLAFLNLDKIQRFKGAGFEAEMKKAVEETYATMEVVRKLGKTLAMLGIYNLAWTNRWGGMNASQKHSVKRQIDSICRELEIHDLVELDEANEQFYYLHSRDHLGTIQELAQRAHNNDKEVCDKIDQFLNTPLGSPLPTVADLKQFVKSLPVSSAPELDEAVQDYEYYLAHHELRRRDAPAEGNAPTRFNASSHS